MPWNEQADRATAWRDNRGKTLAQVPPEALGLPYTQWCQLQSDQLFQEAANRRRNQHRTRQVESEAPGSGNASQKSGQKAQRTL